MQNKRHFLDFNLGEFFRCLFFLQIVPREHAKTKLERSVNYASARCSQQVEHELTDTFSRLKVAANEVTTEYEDKISDLDCKWFLPEILINGVHIGRNILF